ncbi:Arginine--tRNA ligase, cytoplasmic [Labeo rohita]|uniref:Arginine--tRNA ligase, cytoplasmic n=1 Tax=Labeo rohita TaxID=84645 RepID=A0ABQ8L4N7_LABRO|nr:Arginine--tRNA ligase, cytoplasmic [Labeo rohita]
MEMSQTTEIEGSKEWMDEGNKQGGQAHQEKENGTQMDMTVSLESALDRAEQKHKEQNVE